MPETTRMSWDELRAKEYLSEQWTNFEQVYIRKIMGISSVDLGYKLKLPIIGRMLRWQAERMIHSESKNRNPRRADGHFGQVIPLEEAKIILGNLAAEPISNGSTSVISWRSCAFMGINGSSATRSQTIDP
ncbi:MAG: hypothetical protein ABC585_06700 [Candidatus Methanosuratincola petrocarbonis]|nr:hypothetical protein [Candidatus Methanosuratincola sp.]